jgi:hypothetical protein
MRLSRLVVRVALTISAGLRTLHALEPESRAHLTIGIALDPETARYAPALVDEAHAIWRPHGVAIHALSGDATPVDIRLSIAARSPQLPAAAGRAGRGAPARSRRLGEIAFDRDVRPADVIGLDLSAVAALMKTATGSPCDVHPCSHAFLDVVTARALGRVLAHEIGHYLLALPAHARSGLMRSVFTGRELAAVHRQDFVVSAELLPRLRLRVAHLRAERCTSH